jgi:hypothetical protein
MGDLVEGGTEEHQRTHRGSVGHAVPMLHDPGVRGAGASGGILTKQPIYLLLP